MPGIDIQLRNEIITDFREAICQKMEIVPFVHQRKWWAASDGLILSPVESDEGVLVRLPNDSIKRWMVSPRPSGRARFISDLGSFKIGKSFGAGLWLAGFAAVPNARVSLVGIEYDICEPEFSYIQEFLLSERGMGLTATSLQNRPRDGKMWLDLENGARFEAKSWERKDSLKGKEIDAYCFCEAFMLPGIECFTDNSQNLRARQGFAIFPTTPDRPWVKDLHNLGHGEDPEWACVCDVSADVNPYTFDAKAKARDEKLMTREKFAIHYMGQLGDFVGRVYNYSRGGSQFSANTHPSLFRGGTDRAHFHLPPGWDVVSGADTGTFYTALTVAFSPDGDAFVIDEFPNYRYTAGHPEREESITIPQWSRSVLQGLGKLGARGTLWADSNSQFRRELSAYGITLLASRLPFEARTEIAREYFQHGKVFLAPWLSILPFELENASWPEEASAAGKYGRVKDRDHTLDCLEHILSRRPRGRGVDASKPAGRWIDQFGKMKTGSVDPHLGRF